MQLFTSNKKIAYVGLMTALALIFSYVEVLIPINLGIPGVKLGLANIVAVIALYLFGFPAAFAVQILRIILSGFLFGNMYSIVYSLSGGLLSIICMYLLKKTDIFSMLGISIAGGILHNMGQLIVAIIVVKQIRLSYYGPILLIAGVIMGAIIGLICIPVLKRVETYVRL